MIKYFLTIFIALTISTGPLFASDQQKPAEEMATLLAHGQNIPDCLKLALINQDNREFNRLSKQLCFKGCQNSCDKVHQSDNPIYQQISKMANPIKNSAFFQAYGFRHIHEQQYLLDIAQRASPVTHKLFVLGLTKQGPIALYKPNGLEHDWIIKTDSDHEAVIKVHAYKVGDEMGYTFLWDKHTLTLPYRSSGIAASLTRQKVNIDELYPSEQIVFLQCGPAQFNALTRENMGLEIFYQAHG